MGLPTDKPQFADLSYRLYFTQLSPYLSFPYSRSYLHLRHTALVRTSNSLYPLVPLSTHFPVTLHNFISSFLDFIVIIIIIFNFPSCIHDTDPAQYLKLFFNDSLRFATKFEPR